MRKRDVVSVALPTVLVEPPWLKTPAADRASPPPRDKLEEVAAPADLTWDEGQLEKWSSAIPGAKSRPPSANDEVALERLLDAADRGESFRAADVARLGDEALGEWFDACPPARMTAQAMKYVIGRLGETCFERAMEIVEAVFPNTGLVESITPFVSPRVAVAMAKAVGGADAVAQKLETLVNERFTPSAEQRWLERHVREAALGLVPIALDDVHGDARIAMACLRWLAARGRGAELRAHAARFGEDIYGELELYAYEKLAGLASVAADGLDWIPQLVLFDHRAVLGELLASRDTAEVVPLFASWLDAAKEQRELAGKWLKAHEELVLAASAELPSELAERVKRVVAGVENAVDRDRLNDFPPMIPSAPEFWTPESWPPILLEDGTALPAEAVAHLGEMLRFSPFSRPYIGLVHVKSACDRASLDRFMVRLLEAWTESGEGEAFYWVLAAAAHLGGDNCAFQISKRIKSWAYASRGRDLDMGGQIAKRKVSAGLEALSLMDVPSAVVHLDHFANQAQQHSIRTEAEQKLENVPLERRVVRTRITAGRIPDLGLDEHGRTELDFGARKFTVMLDESFAPVVLDADKNRVKGFPRPRKEDDETKVEEAKRRFQRLKGEVKSIISPQITRLERAMVSKSTWKLDDFREWFLGQPLMRVLARRILWRTNAGVLFRVDEEGATVDREDGAVELDGDPAIVVPHPIEIEGVELEAWKNVFFDYELIQPFEQLARSIAVVSPDAMSSEVLPNAAGPVPAGRIFTLTRQRGWTARFDEGVIAGYTTSLPGGHHGDISITPGVDPETPTDPEEQTLVEARASVALGRLSKIAYSELARDVEYLRRPSSDG